MGNYLSNSLFNGAIKGSSLSSSRKRKAPDDEIQSDVKR